MRTELLKERDELRESFCTMTAKAATLRVQRDELREVLADLTEKYIQTGELCLEDFDAAKAVIAKCGPQSQVA